jgi:intein/homing endonuclease
MKLDKNRRYKLACGHNNAGILNLWPFDTWICLDCGYKTKRIDPVYKYEELSEEMKEKVLQNLYDINVNYEWYDFYYEDFHQTLGQMGIKCETFYFDLGRKHYFVMKNPIIYNEIRFLKYCRFDLRTKKAKKLLNEGIRIETQYYAGSMSKNYIDDDNLNECLQSNLESFLSQLQKGYDYLTSEEAIIETIKANEYEFDNKGNIA